MESGHKDSSEPMSREAAKILGHSQRDKSEIEVLNASGSTSQQEDGDSNGLPDCQLVKDLTEVFKTFDKNGDGKISQAELGPILLLLGEKPTEEELHLMVKEVDADGDGEIDLKEFIYLNTGGLGGPKENGDGDGASAAYIRDAIQDAFQQRMSGEGVVGSRSNSITSCTDMMHIMKIAQVLPTIGGELRDARNPTTTGTHKVKDGTAKGNYLLQVANVIENATPNTPHSLPSIVIGHDIMNPMLYPESLEVVAKALQQGSVGKENMSQLVHFLHLLGGDLLDIAT